MAKKMHIPMWKRLGFSGPICPKHGRRPRIYNIWANMCQRAKCTPGYRRTRNYKYYAHVTICDEWSEFPPFYFWAILTGYSDDLSIDRKDWRKGYTPDNCRWATLSEQNKNRHYTEAFREACRRNGAKGGAVLKAKRRAAREATARNGG